MGENQRQKKELKMRTKRELDDDKEKERKKRRRRTGGWNTQRTHLTVMSSTSFSFGPILPLHSPCVESRRIVINVPKLETKKNLKYSFLES